MFYFFSCDSNQKVFFNSFLALDHLLKICDPWETANFTKYLEQVPDGLCAECLPDCTSTIYDTRVSSASFKTCDHTNIGKAPNLNFPPLNLHWHFSLGSSAMCEFSTTGQINPPIWAHAVNQEYKKVQNEVPEWFEKSGIFPSQRNYVSATKFQNLVLKSDVASQPTYNAYDKDIAVVNFYFDKSSILQFTR